MTRHKHADVIIAWANGEDVEQRNLDSDRWFPVKAEHPIWYAHAEYRIKPKIVKKQANVAVYKLKDGSYKVQLLFFGDMHFTIEGSTMVTRQPIEWEEEV